MKNKSPHPQNIVPFPPQQASGTQLEYVFDPVKKVLIKAPAETIDQLKIITAHLPELKALPPPDFLIPIKQTDWNELVKRLRESSHSPHSAVRINLSSEKSRLKRKNKQGI